MSFFTVVANAIIASALKKPYWHLRHKDRSAYMNRYWLMPRCLLKPGRRGGFELRWKWLPALRVHNIVSSDWDRHLHCHPWPSGSVPLRDGFDEVMPRDRHQPAVNDQLPGGTRTVRRKPGDIVLRRATDRHRIVIPPGFDTWSLFVMGPKSKEWFFHTERGLVHHTKYWSVHQ
jgi:hypothetical protein